MPEAVEEFSSSAVLPALREACERAGFAGGGAELVRVGENAIFQVQGAPVVVRIARSADRVPRVERELCVARWLADAGVPTIRVYEEVKEQPLLVKGRPVSFWHTVTGGEEEPTHVDLARLLAGFHGLGECPCELPGFDPLASVTARLEKADGVAKRDRDFLTRRCDEARGELRELKFALPTGPIHGDAHVNNLLVDRGRVVLSDYDAVAVGPREWDLLPTAIGVDRYGFPEENYRRFADTYGFDVRTWDGYPILRGVRELTMTTWIMQNVGESKAVADEFALRVASLREGDAQRAWHFF